MFEDRLAGVRLQPVTMKLQWGQTGSTVTILPTLTPHSWTVNAHIYIESHLKHTETWYPVIKLSDSFAGAMNSDDKERWKPWIWVWEWKLEPLDEDGDSTRMHNVWVWRCSWAMLERFPLTLRWTSLKAHPDSLMQGSMTWLQLWGTEPNKGCFFFSIKSSNMKNHHAFF